MAHPRPHPNPASIAAANVIDAIDDISCHHLPFEAIEALISPQMADCREGLAHVDRASLGWLFTVLNVALRQQIDRAKELAEVAHQFHKTPESTP